jgi:general stress protein YciG
MLAGHRKVGKTCLENAGNFLHPLLNASYVLPISVALPWVYLLSRQTAAGYRIGGRPGGFALSVYSRRLIMASTNQGGKDPIAKGSTPAGKQGGSPSGSRSGSPGASKQSGDTSSRGFASMDPQRQREIAAEGGRAAHEKGTAHEFTSEEARRAGSMSHKNDQNSQSGASGNKGGTGGSRSGGGNQP